LIVAVDTNAFVRALDGVRDERLTILRTAIRAREVLLPPVVVTELLSAAGAEYAARRFVATFPLMQIHDGYWERAGLLRSDLRLLGKKAKLADCLIAQSCIDHDIPLITYDRDFRHFQPAGLTLL
jgi:predicted nucleic acid-binding protein